MVKRKQVQDIALILMILGLLTTFGYFIVHNAMCYIIGIVIFIVGYIVSKYSKKM